ncbi:MAG: DUF1365 domain-containing protein [Burkholderiales bacterium]|nr:DUF1365 domain-containing protein [Burkholderiales bacterium]
MSTPGRSHDEHRSAQHEWTPPAEALIGVGEVRHSRLRPVVHNFSYPTYFLLLPLRTLRDAPCEALSRNRFGLLSFHDRDHGDGGDDALSWIEELLVCEGIADADGEVWLHCYPRVLGYAFKPVSFWYCHRKNGSLAAIVVEVNNTFGERHCYLLAGKDVGWGRELCASKVFHVSPFCDIDGGYRFRFMRTDVPAFRPKRIQPARMIARVDHDDADGPLLRTSISGALAPLTRQSSLRAFVQMPLMTFGVIARIHWQALKLWSKRVPFFKKPNAPRAFLTRWEAESISNVSEQHVKRRLI